MIAKLEYDFDKPEDEMAHLRAVKSLEMASILFEIQYNLPKKCGVECGDNEDMLAGVDLVFRKINGIGFTTLTINYKWEHH